jgi:hypothetical protein
MAGWAWPLKDRNNINSPNHRSLKFFIAFPFQPSLVLAAAAESKAILPRLVKRLFLLAFINLY